MLGICAVQDGHSGAMICARVLIFVIGPAEGMSHLLAHNDPGTGKQHVSVCGFFVRAAHLMLQRNIQNMDAWVVWEASCSIRNALGRYC